jgi:hypothetical protein
MLTVLFTPITSPPGGTADAAFTVVAEPGLWTAVVPERSIPFTDGTLEVWAEAVGTDCSRMKQDDISESTTRTERVARLGCSNLESEVLGSEPNCTFY